MRFVHIAIGSMGDLRPQLTLAAALKERGDDVLVVGLEEYADTATEADVPFRGLGAHTIGPIRPAPLGRLVAGSQTAGALLIRRWMARSAEPIARTLLDVVRPGDRIVTGVLGLAASRLLAAQRGCKTFELMLAPTLPTAYGQCLVGAVRPDRSALNLWASTLVRRGSVSMGRPIARAMHRLNTASSATCAPSTSEHVILACSSLLVPQAPDWPETVACTGHLAAASPQWEPPARLQRFLDAGAPPVYIGFGSVPLRDPVGAVAIQAEAARRAKVRAVLHPAAGFQEWDRDFGPHVHLIRDTPFDWLLPRMAAAVHHGGAGTTQAALAAGVPQGIIPYTLDQPYFARRVAALGLGPEALSTRDLTPQRLARVIRRLTAGESADAYRARAAQLAESYHDRGGLTETVEFVHGW
ncbi:glycosyltransferase [Actinomyces sp. Z5]|uniref:glycosyltransferase n=1 Tax=Actinomyces sp. Z5 TaxID=2250216 RepID=UPI0011BE5B1B|nr:glycosyltransferase [Actinomyces sp. Z5]